MPAVTISTPTQTLGRLQSAKRTCVSPRSEAPSSSRPTSANNYTRPNYLEEVLPSGATLFLNPTTLPTTSSAGSVPAMSSLLANSSQYADDLRFRGVEGPFDSENFAYGVPSANVSLGGYLSRQKELLAARQPGDSGRPACDPSSPAHESPPRLTLDSSHLNECYHKIQRCEHEFDRGLTNESVGDPCRLPAPRTPGKEQSGSFRDSEYDDSDVISILRQLSGECIYDNVSTNSRGEYDMAVLTGSPCISNGKEQRTSSSLIYAMEINEYGEDFDPTLQRSPPLDAEVAGSQATWELATPNEEFLDDNIDWSEVINRLPSLVKDPSPPSLSPSIQTVGEGRLEEKSSEPSGKISPFGRKRFPPSIRDKSPVVGLSRSIMTRTCFRIGELLNEGSRMVSKQQDTIFELYARVTYSNREIGVHIQHFQFVDLFREEQPYPSGVLYGWPAGSLLDRQSASFLQPSTKKCRCICRLIKDNKSVIGWSLVVYSIKQVGWDETLFAKHIVASTYLGGSESLASP
ncbi:hypothetical protein GQ53DRAFT_827092 [Thozetella sp. PMI_491]|nr:hypothetical protein GQ53DRAFT_827092 [Thozetella sp. PMI_491]